MTESFTPVAFHASSERRQATREPPRGHMKTKGTAHKQTSQATVVTSVSDVTGHLH